MGRSSPQLNRPPSPPIFGISDIDKNQNARVVYKQNNQEVVYKQNIMVRWLQPPTPPPPAPIIIRGMYFFYFLFFCNHRNCSF